MSRPATVDEHLAGFKAHANVVVTPSTREAFDGGFGDYATGKGSLEVAYDAPLPNELVRRLLQNRVREWSEGGVRWM